MSDYFLAPSLVALRNEVNAKYPNRDKSSDGWIGDASHAARASEHNPCWTCTGKRYGIVQAIDIDNNGTLNEITPLVKDVLAAAIGDDRVWYVIYARKIYSRTYGWAARAYTGSNPHDHHVHISIRPTDAAAFSTATWLAPTPAPKPIPTLPGLSLTNVKNAAAHPKTATNPVATRRVQRALNAAGHPVAVDGVFGKKTRLALRAYKKSLGWPAKNGYPGSPVLTKLGRNRWRLTK